MAIKIFSVKNKATGQVERLVKAETQGQVNKHLMRSVEIEPVGAVDVVDLMSSGTLRVEDATAAPADDVTGAAGAPAGDTGAESSAGDAGQGEGTQV